MAIEITVPRLGWSMDEGTFGEWVKADGEFVEAGDAIFTLESEKALQEVESVDSGVLRILPGGPDEGDTVTVGRRLAWLLADGEDIPDETTRSDDTTAGARSSEDDDCESVGLSSCLENSLKSKRGLGRVAISPRAKRLALELGIDWIGLTGSGQTGRIRECDIRAAARAAAGEGAVQTGRTGSRTASVRRVIAARMLESAQNTASVTLTSRADAGNLVALRKQFKQAGGLVPAVHDIVARLAAAVLLEHPAMMARWVDGSLVEADGVHIGIAVDADSGLLVPVIQDCDRMGLRELAQKSKDVIDRARDGRCSARELSGGIFSITNLGMYGIDAFTPLLNTPQTAILGLGAIRREAVVDDDDRIIARDMLTLSLTLDHRAVDGAPAARFLQTLVTAIENPAAMLIQ
jgi:pyruvate dehydrogenase E2 component (dihydrolipoamide acetyltransferase)